MFPSYGNLSFIVKRIVCNLLDKILNYNQDRKIDIFVGWGKRKLEGRVFHFVSFALSAIQDLTWQR